MVRSPVTWRSSVSPTLALSGRPVMLVGWKV
jgi:hypothetical protein